MTEHTSLLQRLTASLLGWMADTPDDAPRRVLLWLDPEQGFARLLPHLQPVLLARGVQLLSYDPQQGIGQTAIKLALAQIEREPEGRAVVYLPGFGRDALQPRSDGSTPGLWGLYDYRYRGCVWGLGERWEAGVVPDPPTLLGWLRRHGLSITGGQTGKSLSVGNADSLLARYAELRRDSDPHEWPKPLRKSDIVEALAGQSHAALRQLIAAPTNEVRQWGENRSLVLEKIADEYGLHVPNDDVQADEIADAFVVCMALCEAWDAFGRPDDFPYLSRLGDKQEHQDRQIAFVRNDILPHAELGPRFLQRMQRLESSYNLAAWAGSRDGQPVGLPRLARTRWAQFLGRFDTAASTSWKQAVLLLLDARTAIDAAARVDLGDEIRWHVLQDLIELSVRAEEAITAAPGMQDPHQLIAAYTSDWWRIDRLHLVIRAACAKVQELQSVRRVADLAYFDYVRRVNDRFSELVEGSLDWPPAGTRGCRGVPRRGLAEQVGPDSDRCQ